MNEVTHILSAIERGDPKAAEQLLPLVYDELRKLAAAKLARMGPGQTLQPTALVHEAYLRLVDTDREPAWSGRGHFFVAAAEAMRRILGLDAGGPGGIVPPGQVVAVSREVGLSQRGLRREPLRHLPHQPAGLEPAHRGDSALAGQIVERGERAAVGQTRGGLHDVRQAARAAVGDRQHPPGLPAELQRHGRGVRRGRRRRRAGHLAGALSACCTEVHSRSYHGCPGARAAVAFGRDGFGLMTT